MSEKPELKHLDTERLSALLDDRGGSEGATAHLDACERCRAEFEALSRMRMALSGLSESEPPGDEWGRIEAALEERGLLVSGPARAEENAPHGPAEAGTAAPGARAVAFRYLSRWPAQAAAAFLLFGGGILAGLQLTATGPAESGGSGPAGTLAVRDAGEAIPAVRTEIDEAAHVRQALAELERLGSPASTETAEGLDPASAAERLARLDALIGASREAVGENPADPVANALLFRLVEQRDELAGRLNRSLHLATTLEYR